MNTIGVLLLAAATAGDGFGFQKPHAGLLPLHRAGVVGNGPVPPGGMIGADGMGGAGAAGAVGRRFPNTRSQIFFLDPNSMKIGWQTAGAAPGCDKVYVPGQLTVPARYNFNQGYIYRLKLTEIPGRENVVLYPTIEVAPSTPATDAYLTHNPIPVQFTAEDFDQVVNGGNFVTKVIYLPDPKYQELAIAGVETLVSTRLEPGVDPILEADKRGTILLIVRIGAIDLEMTNPVVVPSGAIPPPGVVSPDALPPGVVTSPGAPMTPTPNPTAAPVDVAPVAPATPPAAAPPVTTPPPPPPPATAPPATTPPPPPAGDLPELPK